MSETGFSEGDLEFLGRVTRPLDLGQAARGLEETYQLAQTEIVQAVYDSMADEIPLLTVSSLVALAPHLNHLLMTDDQLAEEFNRVRDVLLLNATAKGYAAGLKA